MILIGVRKFYAHELPCEFLLYLLLEQESVNELVTWTKVKVLNNNNPLTYLYTSNIYDDKARVIQVQKQNITGGIDISTTQYTWSGQPYITVQSQQKANYPNSPL